MYAWYSVSTVSFHETEKNGEFHFWLRAKLLTWQFRSTVNLSKLMEIVFIWCVCVCRRRLLLDGRNLTKIAIVWHTLESQSYWHYNGSVCHTSPKIVE